MERIYFRNGKCELMKLLMAQKFVSTENGWWNMAIVREFCRFYIWIKKWLFHFYSIFEHLQICNWENDSAKLLSIYQSRDNRNKILTIFFKNMTIIGDIVHIKTINGKKNYIFCSCYDSALSLLRVLKLTSPWISIIYKSQLKECGKWKL